jgi:hypothetical protein
MIDRTSKSDIDVYSSIQLTKEEARSGTRKLISVSIDSASKKHLLNVTIPPATSHGTILRLGGVGKQSKDGKRGDLFLEVKVGGHSPGSNTQRGVLVFDSEKESPKTISRKLLSGLSLANVLGYFLGYKIWKVIFFLGACLQALGFRYSKSLQVFGAYLVLLPSALVVFHIFSDAVLQFVNKNQLSENLRPKQVSFKTWSVRSLVIVVFVSFLGILCPLATLHDFREWIWQENLLVSLLCGLAIFGIGLLLSAPIAEWRSADGRWTKSATRQEALNAFGREWLMIIIGLVVAAGVFMQLLEFTKKDILILNYIFTKIFGS